MDNNIIIKLKKKYGKDIVFKKLESKNNEVYTIQINKEKKVIKIDTKKEDEPWTIQKEIYLYKLLKKHKIPVPEIEYVDESKVPMFYVMEYLGDNNLKGRLNNKLIIKLGKLFAKIHKIKFGNQGIIFYDGIEKYNFKDYKLNNLKNQLKELLNKKLIKKDLIKIIPWLKDNFKDSDKKILCHNDFGPWQAIVKKEEIKGIIDWEWAESSEPYYDVAKTEVLMTIITPNKFKLLKEGYEKVISLTEYDLVKLPYLIVECFNFIYYFKNNKKMFNKGHRLLNRLIRDI